MHTIPKRENVPQQVPNGKRSDLILQIVADSYSRRIITSTIGSAKSVRELSGELNIPMSTCYRRVADLKAVGLLEVERTVLSKEGKKWELFRSTVRKVSISLGKSDCDVSVEANEAASERLQRLWTDLRG